VRAATNVKLALFRVGAGEYEKMEKTIGVHWIWKSMNIQFWMEILVLLKN
jgi:hypothetical protein